MLWFLQGLFMSAGMKYSNSKAMVCAAVLPLLWQVIILCVFRADFLDSTRKGKLIPFDIFESKNSCIPMLAGKKKKLKKIKKPTTQTTQQKTFSNFKKTRYTHLFQLNSAQEWERTPHKGFDLRHLQVIGNFLMTWMGGRSSPGSIAGQLVGHKVLIVRPVSFLK